MANYSMNSLGSTFQVSLMTAIMMIPTMEMTPYCSIRLTPLFCFSFCWQGMMMVAILPMAITPYMPRDLIWAGKVSWRDEEKRRDVRLPTILMMKKEMRVKTNFQESLQLKQSVGARPKVTKQKTADIIMMMVWVLLLGWLTMNSLRNGRQRHCAPTLMIARVKKSI